MKAWQKIFILIYALVSIGLLLATAIAQPTDRHREVAPKPPRQQRASYLPKLHIKRLTGLIFKV